MANLKVATRSFQMREEELKERIHRIESGIAGSEPPQNPQDAWAREMRQ